MSAPASQGIASPIRRSIVLALFCVCLCSSLARSRGAEVDADESVLREAGLPTDGPGLAAFFKQHTTSVADRERIKALVQQLGDDEFKLREEASRQLVMIGSRAGSFLQSALKDADPEIVRRAQDCLQHITRVSNLAALPSAVRLLARRAQEDRERGKLDAAAILLDYLPSAEDEGVAETIHQVLPGLAVRDGKAEPALVKGLTDKSAVKRAAAAVVLAGVRLPEVRPAVRKLLRDPDPQVRARVGLALAAHGEKDAVAVLIRTLEDVPLERNGLVLDLLDRLAAGKPPAGMPVADQSARHKCRQAWETWWKDHQNQIEPGHLEQVSRTLGYTLVVLLDLDTVAYLDKAKEMRWKISNVQQPLDAQLLPDDQHVLLAEYKANRVSERNFRGEIVWRKLVEGPLVAQRLPNRHTFIATPSQLVEVDKNGQELFSYSRPDGSEFMRATKLPDGGIACVVKITDLLTRYVRLQPSGKGFKESKSWDVQVRTSGGRLEVLPNGHVLIPERFGNRVVEFDADGNRVWEVTLDQPIAAVRLPNGNTLVTLMRENRAVEVDRAGKEIWQFRRTDSRVTRALRR